MFLVTGATGNVGGLIGQHLTRQNQPWQAGVRRPEQVPAGAAGAVALDFSRPETFAPAVEGVTGIFLMRPPAIANVEQTLFPFIDAARAAGVEQIVWLSLLGAESLPFVPHARVERYLRTAGMGSTLLRAGFFMQNLETAHRREIREIDEIVVPAGNGKTSFTDVDDIAAVAAYALVNPAAGQRVYDLTGPEALDYPTVAALMSMVLERPIAYRHPSLLRFARHNRAQGTAWGQILIMAGIYTTTRLGMASRVTSDVAHVLGRPPHTLHEYLEDHRATWSR